MKYALAVAAAVAFSSTAGAADLVVVNPSAPIAYTAAGFDWSGFYAGLNAGYGFGRSEAAPTGGGAPDIINSTGGLLGATLGVNTQINNFVLGVEGDIAWTGLTGNAACVGAPALVCASNLNWLGSVKGRAGVALDSVLLFATAGIAAGGVTATVTPPVGGTTGTFSGTASGWTLGGGVELAVTDSVSVKAEYSYYSLGGLQAPIGTVAAGSAYNLTSAVHVAKVGVNFHF